MAGKHKNSPISVGFLALGCPKNIIDSEKMLALIGEDGFILSCDIDNADVVVINTCGFIQPAKEEAIEAIAQAVRQKKKGAVKKVIVAGCLSQRMGKELHSEVKGIDAIVGLEARDRIGEIIKQSLGKRGSTGVYLSPVGKGVHDDSARLLITPGHWAYLRISEGCDRKCSFCTIPAIRGPFRSKPVELILSEAKEIVDNGAVELSIIAQDSSYYGKEQGMKDGLIRLVRELEKLDGLDWIRLMYLYPTSIDDRLIEAIAGSRKIVNYIDMPIQHVNNEVLKKMLRPDRRENTVRLIEKLRRAMADVVLRTTIIVGFPGETDEQFEELLDFVRWAKFDALGCFTFYPELETAAANLGGQVPGEIKSSRADQLMLIQQKIAFEKARQRIGNEYLVLVDEVDESGRGKGRFFGQAPHIDSICHIDRCPVRAGKFIRTKVAATADYDLVVVQIND